MFSPEYDAYVDEIYEDRNLAYILEPFDTITMDTPLESNYFSSFESDSAYEEDRSQLDHYAVYQSLSRRNSTNLHLVVGISLPESTDLYDPILDNVNLQLSIDNQNSDNTISKEMSSKTEIVTSQTSAESGEVNSEDVTKEYQTNQGSEDSDTEWTLPADTDSSNDVFTSSRASPKRWSIEECNRLQHAVSLLGSSMHWNQVASYVGTRSVSQCINKWKNDICKGGRKPRWTVEATNRLREYVKQGLSNKEIQRRMPEYTYIQICQQTRKLEANNSPWEDWEYELLVKLKTSGLMGDTEIGRRLNNRHRDAVKNVWNHLKRERNLD